MFNRDIARLNDERLLKLANYIVSKGTTKHIKSIDITFAKFAELKRLVKSGEFGSLDELEDAVYKEFGIIDNDLDSSGDSDIISKMISMADKDLKDRDVGEDNIDLSPMK